ncbi:MAG TPA: UDP-3-O-(3-hydroxymyristoyl)glucosamine N-acyltransferase [Candidatus Omnitrophota bacterium]|nr:UDP-3-O-(3-hydroxymyristoyl)glucosamine N-acyltransferase [Candidatus Omnitrophota bacterium]
MKTVEALAKLIQGQVIGDAALSVTGITNIEQPKTGCITFVQDEKKLKSLEQTEIACLIVPETISTSTKTLIQVKNPKAAWAFLLNEFFPPHAFTAGISPQASVSRTAKIGNGVTIEPFAVIQDSAEIGDNSVIRAGAYVDRNVKIGKNSVLHPRVMVYNDCQIGSRVILHSGTVIGTDGFGYVSSAAGHQKVPQVGIVVIEDDVEVGANTTIDRATIGETRIGRGCKIDNQVQIGHNVQLGACTIISAQTGISGSTKVGMFVVMGGKVGVGDHCEIGNQVMVGAGAGVPSNKKIPDKQIVFGEPARPYAEARKQIGAQLRAAETLDEVRKLRKELDEIKKKLG